MTRCACNYLSPFLWRSHPCDSMFLADSAFFRGASTGRTMGAIQTEAITRYEQEHGRSAGSIRGISAKGNLLIEESENARTRRKRSGGHYAKKG